MLQHCDHLQGPTLDPLQKVHLLLVLVGLELDAADLTRAEKRGQIPSLNLLVTIPWYSLAAQRQVANCFARQMLLLAKICAVILCIIKRNAFYRTVEAEKHITTCFVLIYVKVQLWITHPGDHFQLPSTFSAQTSVGTGKSWHTQKSQSFTFNTELESPKISCHNHTAICSYQHIFLTVDLFR